MNSILGLDTSNYTTSAALYLPEEKKVYHAKMLLPVKKGQLGLRQSDAVFHHTQQLPQVMDRLPKTILQTSIAAVGASLRPREVEGSYMPCFTVGSSAAQILSTVEDIPLFYFSHQAGHIAAALYSAGRLDLLDQSFLAFHVSGGTTEAVLVKPDSQHVFATELVARTLDLNAGQAIDRVGGMLGLPFPAGPSLEALARTYPEEIKVRPTIKGADCCLSGVENLCRKMQQQGEPDAKIAKYCITFVRETLSKMCEVLLKQYGSLPVLFAGGVMSNVYIRQSLEAKFQALFAAPEFSADNAAGIAVLTAVKAGML